MEKISNKKNEEEGLNFEERSWEIKYLISTLETISSNYIVTIENNKLQLIKGSGEKKKLNRWNKIDIFAEYLALGMEKTIKLNSFLEILSVPEIILEKPLNKESFIRELKLELIKIKEELEKSMKIIPMALISIVTAEAAVPITPMPIPTISLPLIKSIISLPYKYYKNIKKISNFLELLGKEEFIKKIRVREKIEDRKLECYKKVQGHIKEQKDYRTVDEIVVKRERKEWNDEYNNSDPISQYRMRRDLKGDLIQDLFLDISKTELCKRWAAVGDLLLNKKK